MKYILTVCLLASLTAGSFAQQTQAPCYSQCQDQESDQCWECVCNLQTNRNVDMCNMNLCTQQPNSKYCRCEAACQQDWENEDFNALPSQRCTACENLYCSLNPLDIDCACRMACEPLWRNSYDQQAISRCDNCWTEFCTRNSNNRLIQDHCTCYSACENSYNDAVCFEKCFCDQKPRNSQDDICIWYSSTGRGAEDWEDKKLRHRRRR